jgi:hypothetical protein
VLTLNLVCGFKFQVFIGSPIHPPLGALTPSEQGGKKDEDDSFVITIQEDEDKRSTKPGEGVI